MKHAKRAFIILLIVSLLTVTACKESLSEEPPVSTFQPPSSEYIPPTPNLRTVRLAVESYPHYQHTDFPKTTQQWMEETQQEINRLLYEEGSPLRLEMVYVYTYGGDPFHESVARGKVDGFDLFCTDFGEFTHELVRKELAVDITDHLNQHPDLYAMNPQDVWYEARVNGRIYCFPLTNFDTHGYAQGPTRIQVIEGWLDELNSEFPRTIEELKTLLLWAKDKNMPHKILASLSLPPYALHRTYEEWPFYVDEQSRFIFYPDGSVEPYIGSEIFRRDAAILQELQGLDLLIVNNETGNRIDQYDGDPSEFCMALQPNYLSGSNTVARYLAPEKPIFRMGPAASRAMYVSPYCENIDDAMQMLYYLYQHEQIYLTLTYGMEGRDWTRQADGSIRRSSAWLRQEHGAFLHSLTPFDASLIAWAEAQSTSAVDLPAAGFMPSFDQDRSSINVSELYALRRGLIPMSELDVVIQRLNEQGFYDLLEECRRQYEEYLK